MELTTNQIKDALTPLRDCGFIPNQSNSHAEKRDVIEISKIFIEYVELYSYEIAAKAVTEFSKRDRSKNIFSKTNYFRQSIKLIIDEFIQIEENQELLTNDTDGLRIYDEVRFDIAMAKEINELTGKKTDRDTLKALRYSTNEGVLMRLKNTQGLTSDQIDDIRKRWDELDREEFKVLAGE